MYVPPHAREARLDVLHEAIRAISFGTLVTVADDAPVITHLPMFLREDGASATIVGHLARGNTQWRSARPAALATWVGPSFYVSPEWYARERADASVVPTYDYVAVEARGTITFFDDTRRVRAVVDELTTHHERARVVPWSIGDAPADFIEVNLHGIVGFALTVTELTGAWKLSRDEAPHDRAGIADGMSSSDDSRVRGLADRVRAPS